MNDDDDDDDVFCVVLTFLWFSLGVDELLLTEVQV